MRKHSSKLGRWRRKLLFPSLYAPMGTRRNNPEQEHRNRPRGPGFTRPSESPFSLRDQLLLSCFQGTGKVLVWSSPHRETVAPKYKKSDSWFMMGCFEICSSDFLEGCGGLRLAWSSPPVICLSEKAILNAHILISIQIKEEKWLNTYVKCRIKPPTDFEDLRYLLQKGKRRRRKKNVNKWILCFAFIGGGWQIHESK